MVSLLSFLLVWLWGDHLSSSSGFYCLLFFNLYLFLKGEVGHMLILVTRGIRYLVFTWPYLYNIIFGRVIKSAL